MQGRCVSSSVSSGVVRAFQFIYDPATPGYAAIGYFWFGAPRAASSFAMRDGAADAGASNLLFRRNSESGTVEAMPRSGTWGGLNAILHAHQ